ncbi:MAG: sulfatase domain-containing protein, partial [Bacillota bacterium]
MRILFRSTSLFVALTYLLLSAAPFMPLAFGRTVANPAHILGMEIVGWLALWAVFGRPAWFH